MRFETGHFYTVDGKPAHFVERKDGSGMRPTTIADARKLGLLPSVTNILKILEKPALNEWRTKQAVMAVLTSPKLLGEQLDAFVERVLSTERQQDQETEWARTLGTDIHLGMELALSGKQCTPEILPWIEPCRDEVMKRGKILEIEKILVGHGYAGKTDLIQENGNIWLWDWKSASKLPEKSSWPEHRLQLAAYAKAYSLGHPEATIRTGNIYISTKEKGKFALFENPDWKGDYENGFEPLVRVWCWKNNYRPPSVDMERDNCEVIP